MTQTIAPRPSTARRPRLGFSASLARLDWVLIGGALALSLLGVVLVWSATLVDDGGQSGRRQVLSLIMALGLAFAVTRVEPRALRAWAVPLYGGAVIGMLAVFTPLGVEVAGARAWLALPGGFTIQPSELAKVALIVVTATILTGARSRGEDATASDTSKCLLLVAPLLLIVLAQRDTGSALVMVGIVAAMLLVSGAPGRILLPVAGGLTLVAAAAFMFDALPDYQMARLTAFVDPEADAFGAGHNTIQARIAIGAGGLFGAGLFAGSQTQGNFVPVHESDFIFTVLAEELGLIGVIGLLGLLGLVCWRGIRIGFRARDPFGRVLAVGVVAWFAFQSFENIGMALGVTPITGVTLPFVSYGGTSMIAAWLGIGLLQLVHLGRVSRV
ncbi:MAG: rod shape-determining protein RodA [Actinomycetia bacterium]|nr:rod shape-determining protein RodA [Actinomycetes bacterium]